MGVSARRPSPPRAHARAGGAGAGKPAGASRSARATAAAPPRRTDPGSRPRPSSRQAARPSTPRTPKASATSRASSSAPAEEQNPPRQITVRTLVLFLVILVAFIVLAPTLRAYVSQQEQQRDILAQTEAAQDRSAELQRTIERWDDPAFVQAQARERLGFVMPGETAYRVVDPETITGEEVETDPEDGPVVVPQVGPWYLTVTDSIQVAGEVDG